MVETAVRQEELPCIWSVAGVMSYRPCDRDYECESCGLFHALSGQRSPDRETPCDDHDRASVPRSARDTVIAEQIEAHLAGFLQGSRLYLERWYSPRHYWLDLGQGGDVTLGLHPHIPRMLYPVDEITTPGPGEYLSRGEPSGWIARSMVAVPMTMPVSGRVRAVNDRYVEAVKADRVHPADADWLLCVDAAQPPEVDQDLIRGEAVLVWYLGVIRTLKRYLIRAMTPATATGLGATLGDGGAPQRDLEEILGRERFGQLIAELL